MDPDAIPDPIQVAAVALDVLTQLLAAHYHQLVGKGIPPEHALELTKDYQWHQLEILDREEEE